MSEAVHARARALLHEGRSRLRALEQAELERHLAGCAECRGYAAHLAAAEPAIINALHARWDGVRPPAARRPSKPWPAAPKPHPGFSGPLLAGVLALLVVTVLTGPIWLERVGALPLVSALATRLLADHKAPLSPPYTLCLSAAWLSTRYVPLDPASLADQPPSAGAPCQWSLFSADGTTLVDVENDQGAGSTGAGGGSDLTWIVVRDLKTNAERSRFHPPADTYPLAISDDGARLLLQPNAATSTFVDWYLVRTTDGGLLSHIQNRQACWRETALFDASLSRAYCLLDRFAGAQSARLIAYDLVAGAPAGTLDLGEVRVGPVAGDASDTFFEPAVALSPDGRQLAIVRADADRVTLIDAHQLTIERVVSLAPQASLWDFLAPAVAEAKGGPGVLRQAVFSADGRQLYVFTQVVPGPSTSPRGLWLVNLSTGVIQARALPDLQVQWVKPAPDGSVFVFGTTDQDLEAFEIRPGSPSSLWHLAADTLQTLSHRDFTGYRDGRLVLLVASPVAQLQPGVTNSSVSFAPDGRLAYLTLTDAQTGASRLQVVQASSGEPLATRDLGAVGTLIVLPH
jgi:hypothetical protein